MLISETLNILIDQLADGEFHSGEELGRLLGVSRTAVWKHLKKLEELDLVVDSVKGQGYRLPGGIDLLERATIVAALDEGVLAALDLDVVKVVDSTNTMARIRAEGQACSGYVVIAEQQTAGRGRRGRVWVSPFARNVYVSLVWGFDQGAAALEGLSLAVGVAVRRAIVSLGAADITLKWPNDIYHQRRKLGGVLLEMIGDPSGYCQVVIGVGVNISMPVSLSEHIDQDWVNLTEVLGRQVERNKVVAAILSELVLLLADYQRTGFAGLRNEWELSDTFRGEMVRLETPGFSMLGVASGVSDTGAIRLLVDEEEHYFNGGEISLRSNS